MANFSATMTRGETILRDEIKFNNLLSADFDLVYF